MNHENLKLSEIFSDTNHQVSSSSEHNQNGATHHDKLQEERGTLTDIAYKYAHAVAEILTDRNCRFSNFFKKYITHTLSTSQI